MKSAGPPLFLTKLRSNEAETPRLNVERVVERPATTTALPIGRAA